MCVCSPVEVERARRRLEVERAQQLAPEWAAVHESNWRIRMVFAAFDMPLALTVSTWWETCTLWLRLPGVCRRETSYLLNTEKGLQSLITVYSGLTEWLHMRAGWSCSLTIIVRTWQLIFLSIKHQKTVKSVCLSFQKLPMTSANSFLFRVTPEPKENQYPVFHNAKSKAAWGAETNECFLLIDDIIDESMIRKTFFSDCCSCKHYDETVSALLWHFHLHPPCFKIQSAHCRVQTEQN